MSHLRIVNPGGMMTVQDLGRLGWDAYGVPAGGAMDSFALQAANVLVGNAANAGALEITGSGAEIEFLQATLVAVAGADFGPSLNRIPILTWQATFVRAGMQLSFAMRRLGARSYLAVMGGIDVPQVLGSRSTYLPSQFGGWHGRPLHMGDELSTDLGFDSARLAGRQWPPNARPGYALAPTLRFLPGPHAHLFAADMLPTLTQQPFKLALTSNRMGYRLEGIKFSHSLSLPSLGVLPGAIQMPPDGMPILLMRDAQTTGGYPIVANVIQADLPVAAQLLPGDTIRFKLVREFEAVAAYRTMLEWLHSPRLGLEDEGIWLAANAS